MAFSLEMMYCPDFFQTSHEYQPCKRYSKTAIKIWGHLVFLLFFFLPSVPVFLSVTFFRCCARNVWNKTTVKNSYFMATTLNLTKTLSPFVCLDHNFSVKRPQVIQSWKNVEQWSVLTDCFDLNFINLNVKEIYYKLRHKSCCLRQTFRPLGFLSVQA